MFQKWTWRILHGLLRMEGSANMNSAKPISGLIDYATRRRPLRELRIPRGKGRVVASCNICRRDFVLRSRFDRYCDSCREDAGVYRYAEWARYN